MFTSDIPRRIWTSLLVFLTLILNGCGGGGGGVTTSAPYILAAVISFPSGTVPAGVVPSGFNSTVSVSVLDNTSGAPITGASATVNGASLSYSPAYQDYEGAINIAPGAAISVSVKVGGNSYTASAKQFTSYPTITAPANGATWSSATTNLVSWTGVAPNTTSQYGLGVFDSSSGQLIWPSGGVIQVVPTTTTSATISPFSLTAGNRIFIVGLTAFAGMPNAAPNSGIVVGGFNYVPFTVTGGTSAASLVSIAVTPNNPTVTNGKTLQLTATGTYSDNSTQDLSTQVTWASLDATKATVSSSGLVTGGASYGSTTITATSGSISGSATVKVFQPTPSPSPPLGQSVAYQIDYAHSGSAVFANPIVYPSSPAWSKTLNGAASYPLIAGSAVFVTTAGTSTGNGTQLLALNELDGSVLWGPVDIPGTYNWSGLAYDHGKVFVINYGGSLQSFDAATGAAGWSTQLPGQSAFSSPPTAVNGIIYVGGAGIGGTLYAVDESDGSVLWTSSVANGDHSSPAVSGDGVFVSYPCQVYKFDPITGAALWHYGACSGGGGKTPAYANGLLYVRDPNEGGGEVFDAAVGNKVGTFTATPIPALSTQTGFFLDAGTLQAVDLATHNPLWSFTGDGSLVSAPILINQTVFVGSSSRNVYAVDAATGSQLWSGAASGVAAIAGPDEQSLLQPLTGFGAGEGYLIVPAGNVLTAWKLQ